MRPRYLTRWPYLTEVNDGLINFRNDVGQVDTPMPRFSLVKGSNRLGDSLLNLCKASNMRIVNGRLHKDKGLGR